MKTKHNASSSPAILHKVSLDALRPGDILLTRSPGSPTSEFIQLATGSQFSHAILILRPPYALESTKYGVVKFQIDRLAFHDPSNGLLLRSKSRGDGVVDFDELVHFAEGRASAPYANFDVMLSLFRSLPRVERGTFFCSQLVAEAYRQAGFGLIDGIVPERVTPAALAVSPSFERVSPFTYAVAASTLPFEHASFDAAAETSFAQRESKLKQEIVTAVKAAHPESLDSATSFNDLIVLLARMLNSDEAQAFMLDGAIARAIVESKLHLLIRELMPPDSDTFFLDFYLRGALVRGTLSQEQKVSLLAFYAEMNERTSATMADRAHDVDAFRKAYLQSELESIRLMLAIAEESRMIHARIAAVISTCHKLMLAALPSGDA